MTMTIELAAFIRTIPTTTTLEEACMRARQAGFVDATVTDVYRVRRVLVREQQIENER